MSVSGEGDAAMISWKEEAKCDANGVSLAWGEFFVLENNDEEMSVDDDEESDLSSIEEALELTEEQIDLELSKARLRAESQKCSGDNSLLLGNLNFEDSTKKNCSPSLVGLPDILLEKIFHFATGRPSEVCVLERVCKRVRQVTMIDDFWARRADGGNALALAPTRHASFIQESVMWAKKYQQEHKNEILDVFAENDESNGADTLRTVAADLLSRMLCIGGFSTQGHPDEEAVHFRLRGDTVGYIAELLQSYMVLRLQDSILFGIHGYRLQVQRDDLIQAFAMHSSVPQFFADEIPVRRCNVAMNDHGVTNSLLGCSCSLPSKSGSTWRWPGDNCHDVLPEESGRRIFRRLASKAGILEMSSSAFILAEAEFLHALGILLVEAYDASVEMSKTSVHLDADDPIVYRFRRDGVLDMFKVPPPPFHTTREDTWDGEIYHDVTLHTIVPGQIKNAAQRRNISGDQNWDNGQVYGDTWVASAGFTVAEEKEIEESYYYNGEYDYLCNDEDLKENEADASKLIEPYEHDSAYSTEDYENDGGDTYSSGEDLDEDEEFWEAEVFRCTGGTIP